MQEHRRSRSFELALCRSQRLVRLDCYPAPPVFLSSIIALIARFMILETLTVGKSCDILLKPLAGILYDSVESEPHMIQGHQGHADWNLLVHSSRVLSWCMFLVCLTAHFLASGVLHVSAAVKAPRYHDVDLLKEPVSDASWGYVCR